MCCLTPNLRRTSPPRENTTRGHPLAISYLLSPVCVWVWDPSLPTLGSDRDNPDTSQTCNQPHQTNLSSGSSSRSLLFDDLELCAAPFTTARTSPAHHEVALRYLRVFWILRSEGLLPRRLVLPAFMSVSGPENPFLFGSRSCAAHVIVRVPRKRAKPKLFDFRSAQSPDHGKARARPGGVGERGVRETRLEAGHRYGG